MEFKILVVDDEEVVRNVIHRALEREGYIIELADSGESALVKIETFKPDLILLDINLGSMNGIDILSRIKRQSPEIIVIMITAYANIDIAVQAMKVGAYDFIQKPFMVDELRLCVVKALENLTLQKEVEQLRLRQMEKNGFTKIIGQSKAMEKVLNEVKKFAQTDVTVLIEGESGTGKELIAEYIHYLSPRFAAPFVAINCGAVPSTLLESELFGYEKGAFTGASGNKSGLLEQANGGTLFLDEVSEMSLEAQVKFLRVLENGEFYRLGNPQKRKVNLRVIAACNVSLEELVEKGRFRQDLLYRLNIAKIKLPPLRERKADILPLIKYFIDHANHEFDKQVKGLTSEAESVLLSHPFKGNVRELRNIIERVILLTNNDIIKVEDLTLAGIGPVDSSFHIQVRLNLTGDTGGNVFHKAARQVIEKTLELTQGNKSRAAKLLGVPRGTLRHYISRYN